MANWLDGSKPHVIEVTETVDIFAPRNEVWALIKPAENASLFDPDVVRSFQVPGTPTGVGEMQCFLSMRDGREQVGVIEVMEEVPEQLAVTRFFGAEDAAARMIYRLTSMSWGTRLEHGCRFTVPVDQTHHASKYMEQHRPHLTRFLARVKALLEGDWRSSARH